MQNKTKNIVILLILVLVNFLFAYKYFMRFTSYGLTISLAYSAIFPLLYWYFKKYEKRWFNSMLLFWGIVAIYSVLHILLFLHIKAEQLNVDRWSIISGFWQNAFDGKYPYSAKSHMGNYPGPLPVYFLLALPFYLVHEIGYFSLLGFIGFAWFIRKHATSKDSLLILLWLGFSVAIIWEISVRSTIFINALLFLIYLKWLTNIDINKSKYFIVSAILGGLLLSTRSIFAIALVVYGVFAVRNKLASFKTMFWWSALLVLTCSITFLPFLIFYYHEFLRINPFLVQSEFLIPFSYIPILLLIALSGGLACKSKDDLFFRIGLVFFAVFIIYALRICILQGFVNAYLKSFVDLSYSLFCLPFLLFTLAEKSHLRVQR